MTIKTHTHIHFYYPADDKNECVVYDTQSANTYLLSGSHSAILEKMISGTNPGEILFYCVENFKIPESDAKLMLEEIRKNFQGYGLIS